MRWSKHKKKGRVHNVARSLYNLSRLTFSLTLLVILIFAALFYYKNSKTTIWNGKDKLNLIINTNPVLVASLNPSDNTLTFLPIPTDTYVEATRGYGSYRIGAIFGLGELEGKGGQLLSETVQSFLGIPIDGWINIKNSNPESSLTVKDLRQKVQEIGSLETILKFPGYKSWMDENIQTNLSPIDKFLFWWELRKVRFDKIKIGNLEEEEVLSELVLADGSKAKTADLLRLDAVAQKLFSDQNVTKERLKIEVQNGTKMPGVGNSVGRLVTNMGATLVSVTNAESSSVQKTQVIVIGQSKKDSYTAKKLAKALKCDIKEEQNQSGRADIVVVIGLDYYELRKYHGF